MPCGGFNFLVYGLNHPRGAFLKEQAVSDGSCEEKRRTELLDAIAQLEYEQWKSWAYSLMDSESLSKERTKRWLKNHGKHWSELSDDDKQKDREWAEKVLWIIKKHMGIL